MEYYSKSAPTIVEQTSKLTPEMKDKASLSSSNASPRNAAKTSTENTPKIQASEQLLSCRKILQDKLRDNSRLRDSNEKLKLETQSKERHIRDLTALLFDDVDSKNGSKMQGLRERVGECNVHIQNLRRELVILKKKCLGLQATMKRQENLSAIEKRRNQKLEKCGAKSSDSFRF